MMNRPQGTSAAVPRKGEARAVQTLGHIARRIDANEEERHTLLPRFLQGREAVSGLLETGPELAGESLDIIMAFLDRFGKGAIRHKQSRSGIAGQRAPGELFATFSRKAAIFQHMVNLALQLEVRELQRQLEHLAGMVELIVDQYLSPVPVKPPGRAHHHIGRQPTDLKAVLVLQMRDHAFVTVHSLGKALGSIVNRGKAVAASG